MRDNFMSAEEVRLSAWRHVAPVDCVWSYRRRTTASLIRHDADTWNGVGKHSASDEVIQLADASDLKVLLIAARCKNKDLSQTDCTEGGG